MADTNPLVLGGAVVGALILGGLTMSIVKDPPDADVPTTLENVPAGIVQPAPSLTVDPSSGATATVEVPTGPRTTDLDSPIVQPGERVLSEVNLPDGYAPIGEFSGLGCFKVVASQMVGHTLKVLAESACATPMKFAATFQYDKAP